VIEALQLVGAILLIGVAVLAGDLIAGGVEGALGEKPIRQRVRPDARDI
jgi:hypothetical protein